LIGPVSDVSSQYSHFDNHIGRTPKNFKKRIVDITATQSGIAIHRADFRLHRSEGLQRDAPPERGCA
jgi:hypothetical protein